MDARDHFTAAEELLAEDERVSQHGEADPRRLQRAQVYATLAVAAALEAQRIERQTA